MSKITILSDIKRDNSFVEKLPDINHKEFDKVIKSRRSIRVFTKEKIPKNVIKKSLDNSLKAPTSSNLQTWEIYWARSNNIKDKIIRACLSQPAAKTAKELFVFVSRPDNWKRNNQMMIDHLKSKEKPPLSVLRYYQKITKFAYSQGFFNIYGILKKIYVSVYGLFNVIPREPTSFNDMKVWSQKTTALACQNFMLSMRAYGFDTCPMEGFDSYRLKKILNLPKKAQICMVIGAGKRDPKGVYGKQFRFDNSLFIKEV